MPKIPIFQTQARPTAEVGSVKSNIQIPLTQNIGSALEPLTKAIVDYKIKEKNTENKTEALELENRSVIELNDVAKIGDENKILENFKLNSGNLAEDLKYKQKLRDFASKKEEVEF
jgi:hypothetical protein